MMRRVVLSAAMVLAGTLAGGFDAPRAESGWQPFKDADGPKARKPAAQPQLPPALPAMGGQVPSSPNTERPSRPEQAVNSGFGAPYPGTVSPAPGGMAPLPVPPSTTRIEVLDVEPALATDGSGLPQDAWRGMDMAQLEQRLLKLPLPPKAAALARLWSQLILAKVDQPAGARAAGHYDALRLEALYRAGRLDEMTKRLAAGGQDDPIYQAYRVRHALALGNQATACATSKALMAKRATLPPGLVSELYLLAGYCAAAEGNAAGTGIAVELAREAKVDAPVALAVLDQLAGNGKANMAPPKLVRVLDYRLLELMGPIDPAQILDKAEPALIGALATDDNLEPATRVTAAEAAARLNIIDGDQLAQVYAKAAGEGADVPALRRAALVKALAAETIAAKKLQLARTALDDARKARIAGPMAEVLALALKDVQPEAGLEPLGETAAEIFLAGGDVSRARAFAATAQAKHWLVLADIADAKAPGAQREQNLSALDEFVRRNRLSAALLYRLATVLDATDVNVPIPLWEAASKSPQPTTGALPETGVLPQLQDAAKKKEIGRTALLALETGGSAEPDKLHLIALGDTVRALRRAGLEREARQFGLEALIADWPRGSQP